MRRKEFEISDSAEIDAFLVSRRVGVLSLSNGNDAPYAVPVNYGWIPDGRGRGVVVLHGALAGRKLALLRRNPAAQFLVYSDDGYIPSSWTSGEDACAAGNLFRSVILTGKAIVVEGDAEKIRLLDALMLAQQPEGGYRPFAGHAEDYADSLRGVAVLRIDVETVEAKFKFGQNWTTERRAEIARRFEEAGKPETARLLRKYGAKPGS